MKKGFEEQFNKKWLAEERMKYLIAYDDYDKDFFNIIYDHNINKWLLIYEP